MCNRYTIGKTKSKIVELYPLKMDLDFIPDYNLAPTDKGLVITADEPEMIQQMHFGLIPHWAKDKKIAFSTLNAVSEEVMDKKTYAPLVTNHKTCLILADGFYEWDKKTGKAIPYYFSLKDREMFSFAGLWSQWKNGSEIYRSFTMLTYESNEIVGRVHDPKFRMPVILDKAQEKIWLDKTLSPNELLSVCCIYTDGLMNFWLVSKEVNTVRYYGEHLKQSI